MEVIIESKKLKGFLDAITLKGFINDCVLNFKEEGLDVVLINDAKSIINSGMLKKGAFSKYQKEDVKIGVTDVNRLTGFLGTIDGEVNLVLQNNLLNVFNSKKRASFITASEKNIDSSFSRDKFPKEFSEFSESIKLNKSLFLNAQKNASILSAEELVFNIKDTVLNIEVGDSGFDNITESVEVAYNINAKSKFNINLIRNVFTVLSDEVEFSLPKDNFAANFSIKNEDFNVDIIIANAGNIQTNKMVESNSEEVLSNELGGEIESIDDLLEDNEIEDDFFD